MQVLARYPIIVLPALVAELGLEEAVLLQKIFFWYSETPSGKTINEQRWIFNTYETWAAQTGMTKKQVIRGIASLEKQGALITMIPDGTLNRTKHYAITPEWLAKIPTGQMHVPKRADGAPKRADDTILSSYETTKETNIPFAEAGAPAPDSVDALLARMKRAVAEDRTKKIRLHFPSLEELEAQVDGYWASWNDFKTQTLPLENKSKEISAASAASQLALIFEMQDRYQLSAEAMRHGFTTAINKGVPNIMFVIKCARTYKP